MKATLKIIGYSLIILSSIVSCNKSISKQDGNEIGNSHDMEKIETQKTLQKTAEIMTSNLPKRVDSNTTATKVEYLEKENKLIFYYRINDLTINDIQPNIASMKNNQIEFIKNNPNNIDYLKAKVTFEYIYFDIQKVKMASYIIIPSEYL